MAWDDTKPDGAAAINVGDDKIRENFQWLTSALAHSLEFPGTTTTRGYPKLANGNQTTRDAISSPVSGYPFLRTDTSPPRLEVWNGTDWTTVKLDPSSLLAIMSTWSAAQRGTWATVTPGGTAPSSGTLTFDLATGNFFSVTLDRTILTGGITISNAPSAPTNHAVTIRFKQDGTGGRAIPADAWPASVKWPYDVAPTLTSAAGSIDVVTLITDPDGNVIAHHLSDLR